MPNVYVIAGQSNAVAAATRLRAELLQRDPSAIILSVASAGAPLTWGRDGTDWNQSGDLRDTLIAELVQVMRANPAANLQSMVWLQGEADTYAFARAANYQADFLSLLQRLDSGLKAALPGRDTAFDVVQVTLSAQAPAAPERANWSTVLDAQRRLDAGSDRISSVNPDAVAREAGLSTAAMFKDPLHYSTTLIDRLATAVADRAVPATAVAAQGFVIDGTGRADLITGRGQDTIRAGGGHDTILAGDGNDNVAGGTGNDLIEGQAGRNLLWGSDGNDSLFGGDDIDRLYGEAGRDLLSGAAEDDLLDGGAEDDMLYGGVGRDTLLGGAGNDRLFGGFGTDSLTGGTGADVFIFTSAAMAGMGSARDRITDFQTGQDRIDLSLLDTTFASRLLGGGQRSFYFDATTDRLIGDQNGDGQADWMLDLPGVDRLAAADLIL